MNFLETQWGLALCNTGHEADTRLASAREKLRLDRQSECRPRPCAGRVLRSTMKINSQLIRACTLRAEGEAPIRELRCYSFQSPGREATHGGQRSAQLGAAPVPASVLARWPSVGHAPTGLRASPT